MLPRPSTQAASKSRPVFRGAAVEVVGLGELHVKGPSRCLSSPRARSTAVALTSETAAESPPSTRTLNAVENRRSPRAVARSRPELA